MGKVVLSQADNKKLDKLIRMFEEQKKKFEELKKESQDGIIDFESPTDIILYDAYIVLGKLIKKLPNVEGSDVFQEYVNAVLNDYIGDFSKLEDWCTQMLDTISSMHNDITFSYCALDYLHQYIDIVLETLKIPKNIIELPESCYKVRGDYIYFFLKGVEIIKNKELAVCVYNLLYEIISIEVRHPQLSEKISPDKFIDFWGSYKKRMEEIVEKNPLFAKIEGIINYVYSLYSKNLLLLRHPHKIRTNKIVLFKF